jgi:hypothetical protein
MYPVRVNVLVLQDPRGQFNDIDLLDVSALEQQPLYVEEQQQAEAVEEHNKPEPWKTD